MAEELDSTVEVKDQTVEVPSFKARYDWYQTSSDVYVNILVKDDKREKVDVELRPKNLSVTIKLTTGSDYNLELDLAHEIVPDTSRHKELRSKIEIKMRKKEGIHWTKLERDEHTVDLKPAGSLESSGTTTSVTKYPSSSHHARNWDKLVTDINKEEKEEKPEGDTALNKLFQDIYSGGSDEVKRAMNKSFVSDNYNFYYFKISVVIV